MLLVMLVALPQTWHPMSAKGLALSMSYGVLLFFARWLLVEAVRILPAHVVTTLMKLQFIWMVGIGALVFGEWPAANVYLGAAIIMGSGLFLVFHNAPKTARKTHGSLTGFDRAVSSAAS
ncbi:hypothetical protein [Marimonas lutisalis]|uniref:hypothetical protein n=1 Tax=Marimonas lutisalis TaxID=2545756 RepID=UPI0018759B3F|nr:hypothetical protein [Marimonas lutisalis]